MFTSISIAAPTRLGYCPTAVIVEVRHYLQAVPFEPFFIVMSSGQSYPVPTPDHASVGPRGRLVIWFDDGGSVTLSALHIVGIETESTRKGGAV